MKAELLFERRDTNPQLLYVAKAKQLRPDWARHSYDLGRYLGKSEQPAQAAQAFQETLKKSPKHKQAQIDYGILLFNSFRQADEALRTLSAALASSGKITSMDASRAHFFFRTYFSRKKRFS